MEHNNTTYVYRMTKLLGGGRELDWARDQISPEQAWESNNIESYVITGFGSVFSTWYYHATTVKLKLNHYGRISATTFLTGFVIA